MPCSDGGWRGRAESYEQQSGETQAKLDNVTRMLCELCAQVTPNLADRENISLGRVKGLTTWWKKHQKIDRARQEEETKELRKSGLNKLTDEERKALNL